MLLYYLFFFFSKFYFKIYSRSVWAGLSQWVLRLATGWTFRGSNPEGEARLSAPWGPPSLLYNGYRVFPGDKAAGAWLYLTTHLHLAPRLRKE